MISVLFWCVLFLKAAFWLVFRDNLFLGTALWVAILGLLSGSELYRRSDVVVVSGVIARFLFFYFVWCALCCFLPWSENRINALIYAFLPLLVWPFVNCGVLFYDSVRRFCIGVAVGSFVLVAIAVSIIGFEQLSSRFDALAEIGPNTIGFVSALGVFCLIYLFDRGDGLSYFIKFLVFSTGAFLFVALFFSFSKTTIIAFFLSIALSRLSAANIGKSFFVAILAGVGFFIFYYLFEDVIFDYFSRDDAADTLSGRTVLWDQIIYMMNGPRLIFGAGYNSSGYISRIAGMDVFGVDGVAQAHNAVVEAIVNVGMIGVSILFCAVFSALIASISLVRFADSPEKRKVAELFFSIIFLLIIRSVSEGSISQPGTVESILIFYVFSMVAVFSGSAIKYIRFY